ncbi:MAG: GWxTD domain-containing protein [Acidobacteria bacterium]|nr:GWxTD domain-containing protein [Acidobacteriota bacterium]
MPRARESSPSRLRILAAPCAMAALAACLATSPAATSKTHVGDEPTEEWREGPVRYIITRAEDVEFKSLRTEEDRRAFIENFWRRRDPTPETPGNEYRAEFWKRVRSANSQFGRDNPRPGWRSDMGKIFILFGPPDEIRRNEVQEGSRGTIVWTYRNSPRIGGFSTEAGPNTVIAFAQDSTSEYRLTAEPTKLANVWEGLPNPQPPMGQFKIFEIQRQALMDAYKKRIGLTDPVIREAGGPAFESPLGLTMILGRLQQPPKEWTLKGEVNTRQFFGALPFRARADFFKTTGRETQTLFNVAIRSTSVTFRESPTGGKPAIRAFARLLDSTATAPAMPAGAEVEFAPAPGNDTAGLDDDLIFQAHARLAPGSYVARITVLDEVSGRTGNSDTAFTAPDFTSSGLTISTVALASSLDQVPQESAGSTAPFVIGTLMVVPRLGQEFSASDDLAFYYQVYGATPDPATSRPKLNVAYIFFAPDGEKLKEVARIAFEGQNSEAHGYSLPLENWPPGEYILRIEVTDTLASQTTDRDVIFRVRKPS